jgi:hypothetical protein
MSKNVIWRSGVRWARVCCNRRRRQRRRTCADCDRRWGKSLTAAIGPMDITHRLPQFERFSRRAAAHGGLAQFRVDSDRRIGVYAAPSRAQRDCHEAGAAPDFLGPSTRVQGDRQYEFSPNARFERNDAGQWAVQVGSSGEGTPARAGHAKRSASRGRRILTR